MFNRQNQAGKDKLGNHVISYSGGAETVKGDDELSIGSLKLRDGTIYLLKERKPIVSYRLFERALAMNIPGLCVTRQYPERLKENFEIGTARFVWLSHTPGKDHHNPTSIGTLATLISSFIERYRKCVCIIDGLEYLVINNGFQQVLKFAELINEQVMQSDSIVLIPISENAFSEKEMALLERNIETIDQPSMGVGFDKDLMELIDKYR